MGSDSRPVAQSAISDSGRTAFAIALDEDFDPEELDKLGRWREEVRDRPDEDASTTGG